MNLIVFEVAASSKGEIDTQHAADRILREVENIGIAYSKSDVQHEWSSDKRTWKLLLPIVNQVNATEMHALRKKLVGIQVYLVVGS
jgi:hypothetical protein